jgi:hypothetical protein
LAEPQKVTERRPKRKDAGSESGIRQPRRWRRFDRLTGGLTPVGGHDDEII